MLAVALVYVGMIAFVVVSDRLSKQETVALTYHACAYGEQIGHQGHEWHTIDIEAATPYDALARCMQAYTDTRTEEIAMAQ